MQLAEKRFDRIDGNVIYRPNVVLGITCLVLYPTGILMAGSLVLGTPAPVRGITESCQNRGHNMYYAEQFKSTLCPPISRQHVLHRAVQEYVVSPDFPSGFPVQRTRAPTPAHLACFYPSTPRCIGPTSRAG